MTKKAEIGDLFSIRKGKKMIEANAGDERKTSCYRYLQIEDLRDNNNLKYCKIDEKAVLVNPDDIVIAWDGANAGTTSFGLEGAIGSTLARLSPKDRNFYTPYVGAFLKYNESYLRATCTGATIPHVHRQSLEGLVISLPDISVQRNIAEILDKAKNLIDKRKQQIEILDEFLQSAFLEMFGDPWDNVKCWAELPLADVIIGTPQNGLYKPAKDYTDDGSGTPILRIDSFYNGETIDFSGLKRLNCSEDEINRYKLCKNNIVINRVNSLEYLGKCGLVPEPLEDTVFESNMMRIYVDETIINPVYLSTFLSSQYVYSQILRSAKKAVNQASINQKDVTSFNLLVPPIELQNKFASLVSEVDSNKNVMNLGLLHLEKLFNSIMQQAFTGELFS